MDDRFCRDKAAGQKAEEFVETYGKTLLFPRRDHRIVIMLKRFEPELGYYTDWPKDVTADGPLEFGDMRKTTEEIHIEGGDLDARIFDPLSDEMIYGWIEVKAANKNALLRYGVDNNPSVPFELTSNMTAHTPGWLWHLTHPQESLELRKMTPEGLRTLVPSAMVFCQYEGMIGETPPYAVISFYDFPLLLDALTKIAQERYGWDLKKWDLTPKTHEQRRRAKRECIGANWNVCLVWLQEKGVPFVVYLLGDPPRIEHNDWYEQNLATWKNLQRMAAAHYRIEQLILISNKIAKSEVM